MTILERIHRIDGLKRGTIPRGPTFRGRLADHAWHAGIGIGLCLAAVLAIGLGLLAFGLLVFIMPPLSPMMLLGIGVVLLLLKSDQQQRQSTQQHRETIAALRRLEQSRRVG
jgi:hypothetical protein